MANHEIPRFLLRRKPDWRDWLEDFPKWEGGGYVPAGIFLGELESYLAGPAAPQSLLTSSEAQDVKNWFDGLVEQSDRSVRENKPKNAMGYLAAAIGLVTDVLLTGGAVTGLKTVAGMVFVTTFGLDYANSIHGSRIHQARDRFRRWVDQRRSS